MLLFFPPHIHNTSETVVTFLRAFIHYAARRIYTQLVNNPLTCNIGSRNINNLTIIDRLVTTCTIKVFLQTDTSNFRPRRRYHARSGRNANAAVVVSVEYKVFPLA